MGNRAQAKYLSSINLTRIEKQTTLTDVGELLGVAPSTACHYLSGATPMTAGQMRTLCEYWDVDFPTQWAVYLEDCRKYKDIKSKKMQLVKSNKGTMNKHVGIEVTEEKSGIDEADVARLYHSLYGTVTVQSFLGVAYESIRTYQDILDIMRKFPTAFTLEEYLEMEVKANEHSR